MVKKISCRVLGFSILLTLVVFGNIVGCGGGGEDGLYIGGEGDFREEVNCEKAFDNDRAFCCSLNPGYCCVPYNCGLFSCSYSCAPELGICCEEGYNLCPYLNICVTDIDHCPREEKPLDSGVFISEVEAFCTETDNEHNITIYGIAYGPVGTEVKVHFPDFPDINIHLTCWGWEGFFDYTNLGCIRNEDEPPATSWYFSFPQNYYIDKPAPEFDIVFYTDSSRATFTQRACP